MLKNYVSYLVLITVFAIAACAPDGAKLFKDKCAACHNFKGFGGSICPDLTDITKRRSDAFIKQQILDPAKNKPDAKMQGFPEMSDKQIQTLIDYFKS
jgi:cytochrome c peroxidase